MSHQRKALRFVRERQKRAGLFMAPGTGKTLVAIRATVTPALVICRRDDFLTWERELSIERRPKPAVIDSKSPPDGPCGKWTLVTYGRLRNVEIQRWIEAQNFETVIADEGHFIKRWKAEQTKATIRATEDVPRRLLLTGTPVTNDAVEDVFSLCLFIAGSKSPFGTDYWRFKTRYFLKAGPKWVPRRKAIPTLKRELKKIALYVHEDDVLDLPPVRRIVLEVSPTGQQRRFTRSLLDDWEIPGQDVELDYVIARLAKLRQVAGGFVYVDGRPLRLRENKSRVLLDSLAGNGRSGPIRKAVVWCAHSAEVEHVTRTLSAQRISNVVFTGNRRRRDEARKRFQRDSTIRVFVSQADRGLGMNELVVANTAYWWSNSTKVASRLQAERRTRRKGSEIHRNCVYYDLVTRNSVDETILRALRAKINLAESILSHLKRGESFENGLRQVTNHLS